LSTRILPGVGAAALVGLVLGLGASCGAMPNPPRATEPAPMPAKKPASAPVSADPSGPPASPPQNPPAAAAPAAAPAASTSAATSAATTTPTPQAGNAASRGSANGLTIAHVAGSEIDVSELLALWLHQDSLQVLESLDHIVLGRLVLAESNRLGIKVDPDKSEKAYQQAVDAIEKTLAQKRPGITLDRYVDEALGLDPVKYREYLRDESLRGLLAERVVRAWVLGNEHAEIRVIVVRSDEDSRKVGEALAAGETFEEVAKKLSADPSAKDGGRVPPVVRGETPISRLAFATDVGKVGGPSYEKGSWLYVFVEAKPAPIPGGWDEVAAAVEKSLVERPIAELEVSQWKPAMVARYGVDVSPFLRIAGQGGR
jgi:parvulin-like peptidyl-prolyl isomerase